MNSIPPKAAHFIEIPDPYEGYDFITISRKPLRRGVRLKQNIKFYSNTLGKVVTIKIGFESDGASVPQRFWDSMPPFGEYLESAIIHDKFCKLGETNQSPINFKVAARLFREAMAVQNVRWWRRNKMYLAVRWFGPKFKAKK